MALGELTLIGADQVLYLYPGLLHDIAEAHGKMSTLEYVGGKSNEVQLVGVVYVILLPISCISSFPISHWFSSLLMTARNSMNLIVLT